MAWRKGLSYKNEEHETWNSLPVSVVYNGCDEALKAAQTVLQYTRRHPLTLYLVDNASPDGSGARLEAAVKGGTLSTSPARKSRCAAARENGGFGTGHNTVLPELTSDYHFILNPDIQLTADTLSDLADWMAAHPDAVMAPAGAALPRMAVPRACRCGVVRCGPWSTASCRFEILGEI